MVAFDDPPMPGHRVTLLRDGAEAYPAMLDAIAAARQSVQLEMYWFGADRAGGTFADALMAAARRGVTVALLHDGLGSLNAGPAFFERLRGAGVRTREFRPLRPWHPGFRASRIWRRDHRKVLIVDGAVAFVGGVNLADEWLPRSEGGGAWRDDVVAVVGPIIAELQGVFRQGWRQAGGGATPLAPTPAPTGDGDERVAILTDHGLFHRRAIGREYVRRIRAATRRVWIANSYFLPDPSVIAALELAGQRRLDVRIVVPAVSDVEVVRHAGRATYDRLLRAGVRLFEWHRSILHSKSALLDDWGTVGSFNLDALSLLNNLELNVAVAGPSPFTEHLAGSLAADAAASRELTLDEHRQRGLLSRLQEAACHPFRGIL